MSLLSLKQFANPSSKNASKAFIPTDEFELLLESCVTIGPFYVNKIMASFYWSAVIGVYNAIQNQYGNHTDSYIAIMEKQKADSADIVYWLHCLDFVPELESGNSIEEILTFISKDFDIGTETLLVIHDHIRELRKHNHVLSPKMHKAKAVLEFGMLPDNVRDTYQELIDNNLQTKISDQASAQKTVLKMFHANKDVIIDDLNPEKIYRLVVKLDENLDKWIQLEEGKKYKAGATNDRFALDRASANLSLLDPLLTMTGRLIRKADEIEQTNTSIEISDQMNDKHLGLNDQADAAGVNPYNGGYNID